MQAAQGARTRAFREFIPLEIDARAVLTKRLFPGRFYDAFFISEYGRIEAIRATRYNSCFSIILIAVDGFAPGAAADGRGGLDLLERLAAAVLGSIRSCDVAALSDDGRQITVILPETDYFGSLVASRKLSRAIEAAFGEEGGQAGAVLSHSTFPRDGRTFPELAATASRRAAERQESLWESMGLGGRLFWEIVGSLTNTNFDGMGGSSFDAGSGQDLSEFFIDQINELIVKEIARSPQRRGIMYYGTRNISGALPAVRRLGAAGAVATRVFLVGESGGSALDIPGAVPLVLDDPRLRETFFTFFFSEETAYALVCRENWGATFSCFHTSDPVLVEGLITKFQNEYSLQEQLG